MVLLNTASEFAVSPAFTASGSVVVFLTAKEWEAAKWKLVHCESA